MDEAAAAATMTLTVQCTDANKFSVSVPMDTTVVEFKALIAAQASCPAEQQRLIHRGRVLKDDATLESYGTCSAMGRRRKGTPAKRRVCGALRLSRLCRPPRGRRRRATQGRVRPSSQTNLVSPFRSSTTLRAS